MTQRHAIVTGAASGIGRAAAIRLRQDGFHITALDRHDPGDAADTWHEIDLDDPVTAHPTIDRPVHALINAAGLPPRPGTEAQILRVNVLALRRVTLHILPHMPPGGAIVNVASKAGAKWRENMAQVRALLDQPDNAVLDDYVIKHDIDPVRAYDLSKEAVVTWTKRMTGPLLDRHLRMNAVSPAAIDTPILEDFERAFGERATRGIAMTRRTGRPEEVAEVIAFLASPASEWVRGCNIETDGGLTAMLETEKLIDPA